MYKIEKTNIGGGITYYEISNDEFTYLVFTNNSKNNVSIKVGFKVLENLIFEQNITVINLMAFHFDYLKLKKHPKIGNNTYFILQYSLKNI
jgi:hypothetical protein